MAEKFPSDTIAAVATPAGNGGIAVIRLSGPESYPIAEKVFYSPRGVSLKERPSHTLHTGRIRDDAGRVLDQVLVGLFRAPHSYTGEDVIEINAHGGSAVTRKILDLLIRKGARHAEPGEFTRRAFLNGKIDLTQAEAVLDLIKAKSGRSLETAVRQLTGSLSERFRALKDKMMRFYAHLEAGLDFSEDPSHEVSSREEMIRGLRGVETEMIRLIAGFKRGAALREGVTAVIIGKPNVGKSALFNALLERDRALVSEYPGTTRDRIEESIEVDGIAIRLIDTAGLAGGAGGHPLDRLGMDRTRAALKEAQIFLYLLDGSMDLNDEDRFAFEALQSLEDADKLEGSGSGNDSPAGIVIVNKCDLPLRIDLAEVRKMTNHSEVFRISAKTRQGFEPLEKRISEIILKEGLESGGESITRLRHRNALESSLNSLRNAVAIFENDEPAELAAVDLKEALDRLRELIGEIYSEDLLDVIFSEFCVGK